MLLKIMDLCTRYGSFEAIRNINIEINPGEAVALLGANGAGKTTLLNTISGLIKPSSGQILFDEENIEKLPPHKIVQRGISLCPEGRWLFPYLTVLKTLQLGAFIHRRDSKKVNRNLDYVFELFPVLEERKNQLAGTMSGGEQQMLAVARAVMSEPKLLLIDEPSLGLAPMMVERIGEAVTEISSRGTTIFLIEQNASVALSVCQRAYVMDTGQITLGGAAAELMNNDVVKKAYIGL